MTRSPNLPKISVILYVHNEGRFLRETIDSLLLQETQADEIFVSDDGSNDDTYSIIQYYADKYAGKKPHFILNRNIKPMGIGQQINLGVEKTSGELIILANGDDVYPSNRFAGIVHAWLSSDRPTAIWSDAELMEADGKLKGVRMKLGRRYESLEEGVRARFGGPGATCLAFRRDVFKAFGPLPDNLMLEDNPLFARAFILGPTVFIDQALVHYRVHEENISQAYYAKNFLEWRARRATKVAWQAREGARAFIEILRDLHQAPSQRWPQQDISRARWIAIEKLYEAAAVGDYYTGDNAVSEFEGWQMILRLTLLRLKISLKKLLPWIERRNEAWEFQQYRKQD